MLASYLLSLALVALVANAASIQKRGLFGMDTFSGTSCQDYDEFIEVGDIGANSNTFPGPRSSFLVINTNGNCEVILWTGDYSGTKVVVPAGALYNSVCFGGSQGESFQSFDIHCFGTSTTGGAQSTGSGYSASIAQVTGR